jgi:hypothetical protein
MRCMCNSVSPAWLHAAGRAIAKQGTAVEDVPCVHQCLVGVALASRIKLQEKSLVPRELLHPIVRVHTPLL